MAVLLGAAMISGGLISCRNDAVYAGTHAVNKEGWLAENPGLFEWEIDDTLRQYDFFLDLRHDQAFPFSNVYFFVETRFPNGRLLRDTVGVDLADSYGRWTGSGAGQVIDHRILYRGKTGFPLRGKYQLSVQHAMRVDPLPGVLDIGFRLESARTRH